MSKADKRTPYSKDFFTGLKDSDDDYIKAFLIMDELVSILQKGKGYTLSLIEKNWVYENINMAIDFYPNEQYWINLKPYLKHPELDYCHFKEVYKDYFQDVDTYYILYKMKLNFTESKKANSVIPKYIKITELEKENDRLYLINQYLDWESNINNEKNSDQLLYKLAKHTRKFRKNYINNGTEAFGENWRKKERKKLILRSKYMYIMGKEIFHDNDYFGFQIGPNTVEYNYDSHCHIAVRHFSYAIGQNDKSHFSQDFDLRNNIEALPNIFKRANELNIFNNLTVNKEIGLFFEYNNNIYTLWIKKALKDIQGTRVPILQVNTFYPSEAMKEKVLYSQMSKINAGEIEKVSPFSFEKKTAPLSFFNAVIDERFNIIQHI